MSLEAGLKFEIPKVLFNISHRVGYTERLHCGAELKETVTRNK